MSSISSSSNQDGMSGASAGLDLDAQFSAFFHAESQKLYKSLDDLQKRPWPSERAYQVARKVLFNDFYYKVDCSPLGRDVQWQRFSAMSNDELNEAYTELTDDLVQRRVSMYDLVVSEDDFALRNLDWQIKERLEVIEEVMDKRFG